jgi:mRNA-degrading endonuclease RelE of RelBE toxin-antitoxin system
MPKMLLQFLLTTSCRQRRCLGLRLMNFFIAESFVSSLARLSNGEQKAVKTTAFDLQINPDSPGLSLHKLDRAKDKNFWSVRASSDIRLIVHRTDASFVLCYADHHDAAYQWAERRKLETHPKTGLTQLVEIRETVKGVVAPASMKTSTPPDLIERSAARQLLFAGLPDDYLLDCGVPLDWLDDVKAATEDSFLPLAEHLPAEASDALLELATGNQRKKCFGRRHAQSALVSAASLEINRAWRYPHSSRELRLVATSHDLERALDAPWDEWGPDFEAVVVESGL